MPTLKKGTLVRIIPDQCCNQKSPRGRKSPPRKLSSPAKIAQRKGPIYHAKEFRVGEQMRGQDGYMWKIKLINKNDGTQYKRWVRV
jgi:hypothetical protein